MSPPKNVMNKEAQATTYTEFATDLLDVHGLVLVRKRGIPRDDKQALEPVNGG
jgi:hypothetical protein